MTWITSDGGPDASRLGGQGDLGRGARLWRRRGGPPGRRGRRRLLRGRSGTATFQYNHDPEKTRQTFNDKGWSTLWDVGHLDEEGYLYLTDRKLFMIVSGGVNIYPQEIEDVLVLHPAVADVAVFGIPDPEMGEEVKAVVQPAPGAEPGPELEAEIVAFCRANLSHYKCPRTVDFTDLLPRGENGKLYKKALREAYWASSGPQHHLNLGRRPHVGVPGQAEGDHGTEEQYGGDADGAHHRPDEQVPHADRPTESHHPQRHDPAPHVLVHPGLQASC